MTKAAKDDSYTKEAGKCTSSDGSKVKSKQSSAKTEADCKTACGKDSKCTGFNFNEGKCSKTYSSVKGDGKSDSGDCEIRDESDKLVKKTITDRNGDKKEKEVHAFAPETKAEKNSAGGMIPHEKANEKSSRLLVKLGL